MVFTISLPQTTPFHSFFNKQLFNHYHGFCSTSITTSSNVSFRQYFVGHPRVFNNNNNNNNNSLSICYCSINDYNNNISVNSNSNSIDWNWDRWNLHFSQIEQFESLSSVLKFHLEEAIEKEDFQEAANLKAAIAEISSKDTVAEIMSELKEAIAEERYQDASKLSRNTGSGLVGWWIGSAKDSGDPFGRLVRITPGVGKFIGRTYTPRQIVTASPGTTLFEIYVVKSPDGTYAMQVVYLQRSEEKLTSSPTLHPKPTSESPNDEPGTSSTIDVHAQANKDNTDNKEERVLNIEGATEEGIKTVINFLKDRIPGLKVKVMNISVAEEDSESSDDESDDLDETDKETDRLTVEGNSSSTEDGSDLDMKVFVGGIVHKEDDVLSKEEYIRLPAQITDAKKDSFILHVPGIHKSAESEAAALASQGVSEFMPANVAKAFLGSDMLSPEISRNVRDIIKLAVSQAQKGNKLSEHTQFDRIKIPEGKLDPFDGLYIGAFGPHGTEIVQVRRKFGRWSNGDELEESCDIEFYEYVEAIKLTGDLNVPAGQVTFRAKIGKGSRLSSKSMYPDGLGVVASYKGQGRIAEVGFKNPKWVEGELLQLSGKGAGPFLGGAELGFLYIVPEQSFLVIFRRLNLPE